MFQKFQCRVIQLSIYLKLKFKARTLFVFFHWILYSQYLFFFSDL